MKEAGKNTGTVLLGLKPFPIAPPVRLETEPVFKPVEVDPDFDGLVDLPAVPVGSIMRVYGDGKLVATTRRWILKKDLATGHMTLRLFKNQTDLH